MICLIVISLFSVRLSTERCFDLLSREESHPSRYQAGKPTIGFERRFENRGFRLVGSCSIVEVGHLNCPLLHVERKMPFQACNNVWNVGLFASRNG